MFASSDNIVCAYMGSSSIRFDLSIPEESIFGPERDRYCRHMFERAVLRGENIDPWQMWKRVSKNDVACKYCRLFTNSEYIKHECGWWERALGISGTICFCFCHDDLGYALNDGDQFVLLEPRRSWRCFERWRMLKQIMLDWSPVKVNELRIDYIHGRPLSRIKYVASRDGRLMFSDDDTGPLHPSDIVSIQAFFGFQRQNRDCSGTEIRSHSG